MPALAFWKLDRTNRVAARCLEWISQCQHLGIQLVSHQDSAEELNSATVGAKLATGIKALIAEVESDSMSERQLAAKRHLAEAGFHHGGNRPLGWIPGPRETDEFGRTGVRLIPHPAEHPALQDAVRMVLTGKRLAQVAQHWNEKYGITTAHGTDVYDTTIHRALISPRMIGYRMRNVPPHERGVKINLLDHIARDRHGEPVISQEPVCDRETWLRVCRVLERTSSTRIQARKPWGSYEWLLTGLLHCKCGTRMYSHQKYRTKTSGEREAIFTYRCIANRKCGPGSCSQPCSVGAPASEAHVLEYFFAQTSEEEIRKAKERRADSSLHGGVSMLLEQLENARSERTVLLSKQGSFEFQGSMITTLLSLLEAVQIRIDTIQHRLDAMDHDDYLIRDAPRLVNVWPSLSLMERRTFLRRVIHRIEIVPGRAPVAERLFIEPKR